MEGILTVDLAGLILEKIQDPADVGNLFLSSRMFYKHKDSEALWEQVFLYVFSGYKDGKEPNFTWKRMFEILFKSFQKYLPNKILYKLAKFKLWNLLEFVKSNFATGKKFTPDDEIGVWIANGILRGEELLSKNRFSSKTQDSRNMSTTEEETEEERDLSIEIHFLNEYKYTAFEFYRRVGKSDNATLISLYSVDENSRDGLLSGILEAGNLKLYKQIRSMYVSPNQLMGAGRGGNHSVIRYLKNVDCVKPYPHIIIGAIEGKKFSILEDYLKQVNEKKPIIHTGFLTAAIKIGDTKLFERLKNHIYGDSKKGDFPIYMWLRTAIQNGKVKMLNYLVKRFKCSILTLSDIEHLVKLSGSKEMVLYVEKFYSPGGIRQTEFSDLIDDHTRNFW